jgi:hypothetical protein|tara:strand:+ start:1938 stop:2513 length:576 start_codon:yes stop_codon:yes gene_type:complete
MKSIATIFLASASLFALSANAQVYFDNFNTDTSGTSSGGATYDATGGVGGSGAVVFTNDVPVSGKPFSIDIPVSFGVDTDVDVSFDAIEVLNQAGGVFHLFITPEGAGQENHFNLEGSIGGTYTPLSFSTTVPASSTFLNLRFEAVTGGDPSSTSSYGIDNLLVTVPEPSIAGALFGLAVIGFATVRRRRA